MEDYSELAPMNGYWIIHTDLVAHFLGSEIILSDRISEGTAKS